MEHALGSCIDEMLSTHLAREAGIFEKQTLRWSSAPREFIPYALGIHSWENGDQRRSWAQMQFPNRPHGALRRGQSCAALRWNKWTNIYALPSSSHPRQLAPGRGQDPGTVSAVQLRTVPDRAEH